MKLQDCEHGNQFNYIKDCETPDFKGLSFVQCRVCAQTEILSIPLIGS